MRAVTALTMTAMSLVVLRGTEATSAPVPTCQGQAATIVGTEGPDNLVGTPGVDVIVGLGGNDHLNGGGGNDILCGGTGDDSLWGGGGDDTLIGNDGADNLSGDAGRDSCEPTLGGGRNSSCESSASAVTAPAQTNDALGASTGSAVTTAGWAALPNATATDIGCHGKKATLIGTPGNDTLRGTAKADVIVGLGGDDRIVGGGGDDLVCGSEGKDLIWGGGGNDLIFGEDGADQIWGDSGVDRCDLGRDGAGASGCEEKGSFGSATIGPIPKEPLLGTASITKKGEFPSAATTGVPAGTKLTRTGDLLITKDNTVIDGLDIDGCVKAEANNVIIRRSRIRCSNAETSLWQFEGYNGMLVEDVTIEGRSRVGSGIYSQGKITIRRVDISKVGDGIFVYWNAIIEDSWIHDLSSDGVRHNDLIQMVQGSNVIIRNNRLEHRKTQTSAIMLKSDFGSISNVTIDGNYLGGGSFTLYVYAGKSLGGCCGNPTNIKVTNNTFSGLHLYGAATIQGDALLRCNKFTDGVPITYFANDRMKEPQRDKC